MTEELTIEHAYLTKGDGSPLKFYEIVPDRWCVMCSKGPKKTPMALYARDHRDEVIHCIQCDHQETRRHRRFLGTTQKGHT